MKCDRRLLSDYLDGELPSDLDREVAQHLITCESCRQVVQEYRRLGRELRQIPRQPVPATVEARIRDRLGARRQSPLAAFFSGLFARPLVPALGSLAAALLIVFAVVFQQTQTNEPRVVSANAQDGGIDVVFDRPVDASTAQWQFVIDPPADVKATIVGNKVELRPEQPLQPDTTYVVVVEQKKPTSGVAAIPAVAAIEPRQAPVQISFISTGTELVSVSPTSSPTPRKPASPTPGTTPTSVAIAAVSTATAVATPASRATPVVVVPPTVTPKASPTVTLDACVSDVNPSIVRLLASYPDAERRLVCAIAPAETATVAQQTFARGIVVSVSRDEAYVLFTGSNPNDQRWTGYGARARAKTPSATPTAAAATPAATATVGATASPDTQSPAAISAASSAATPTGAATAVSTPAPTATPTVAVSPGPTDTPVPATATPAAGKVPPTPTPPAIGKEVRRLLGEPADVEEALGAPVTSEGKQQAVVQDLAGGTVIAFGDSEAYVLLADGHWDRVDAPTPTAEPARQPAVAPSPTATPSPAARRSPATPSAVATPPTVASTATPTPAR